jgi:hypothetical protein
MSATRYALALAFSGSTWLDHADRSCRHRSTLVTAAAIATAVPPTLLLIEELLRHSAGKEDGMRMVGMVETFLHIPNNLLLLGVVGASLAGTMVLFSAAALSVNVDEDTAAPHKEPKYRVLPTSFIEKRDRTYKRGQGIKFA